MLSQITSRCYLSNKGCHKTSGYVFFKPLREITFVKGILGYFSTDNGTKNLQ